MGLAAVPYRNILTPEVSGIHYPLPLNNILSTVQLCLALSEHSSKQQRIKTQALFNRKELGLINNKCFVQASPS